MPSLSEIEIIRRKQILDAAMQVISEKGLSHVTMADICHGAGLSKGGLAHYYSSKQMLITAVFGHFFNRIFEKCRKAMEMADELVDKLMELTWIFDRSDEEVRIGYPLLFDFIAYAMRSTECREVLRKNVRKGLRLIANDINVIQEKRHIDGLNAEEAARELFVSCQGIAACWYLAPDMHSTEWAVRTLKKAIRAVTDASEVKSNRRLFEDENKMNPGMKNAPFYDH